ncbi:branched-chain amino acid ABC transporter permease [Agrobacterium sp. NPDC090273]|uniref:ABC transporter permease subunit n=1 Tax=Agrobacterium sp. NPDC090273 TaxID=3363919 RepID=UPI00383B3811
MALITKATKIAALIAVCVITALMPYLVDLFTLMQFTLYASMSVLALALAFIWGFGGILSFGQTAFFGLGAYAYAIGVINFGDSTLAIPVAILLPSIFAALLGYFMFYGRVSDVYLGVITLTVSLILFNVVNSTSGDEYKIGTARIGGFNGIPSVPTFNAIGDPSYVLSPEQSWWFTGGCVIAIYLVLKLILASTFGRIAVGVRENETRAALLGYDPRLIKLGMFVLGGAISGFAGCLFVNWGAFVSPAVFALSLSAQTIIWVVVGGLGTLVGPVIGCIFIQQLVAWVGTQQTLNSYLALGIVLVGFVRLLPQGIAPTIERLLARIFRLKKAKPTETVVTNGRHA